MIEPDIKADLEHLTGLNAYPLKLPSTELNGIVYQRISDPKMVTGLAKTSLVQARFQVTIQLVDEYAKALMLDSVICEAWEKTGHGYIGKYPVQSIQRAHFQQDMVEKTDNQTIYRIIRDYVITYAQGAK